MSIFNKKSFYLFSFIVFIELISFLGYFHPELNRIGFLFIVLAFLILTLIKFEYGVLALLIELFISSKGYLFYYDFGGVFLSIRIAFWLILMSVWFASEVVKLIKTKKIEISFFKSEYFSYFVALFIFVIWGLVNGFLNHNAFNNIFFDFNGWLFWLLIFPIFSVIYKRRKIINNILQVFLVSTTWVSLKTLLLLYIFSHNISGISSIYRWIRETGVGEITLVMGGFYRIFFQSHIFVLIGFFIILIFLINFSREKIKEDNKIFIFNFLLLIIFTAVNLISFSRSNWLGMVCGLLSFFLFVIWKLGWKRFLRSVIILLISLVLSFGLIISIVKFPFPDPTGGFDASELFSKRATQIMGEAGASSRWALLPKLWTKIKESPILGKGFGTTVTYVTSDPRFLETSITGEYTTYAFEWGWLDIWLKLGIFGLLSYLLLLFIILYKSIKKIDEYPNFEKLLVFGLLLGIISISVVSFFSPYMNHPLGIGYLVLATSILSQNKKLLP